MKRINLLISVLAVLFISSGLFAQNVWFNEIHYDNDGTDADEFLEVILENQGGYTLSDFTVILYNGNNGASYDTRTLDQFTQGTTINNFTVFWFNYTAAGGSIQNGSPDGMALSYQGNVVTNQFLSYEGTFMATDGPASGMTSVDIGVEESSTTPVGYSLQLSGVGTTYPAFTWQPPAASTPGNVNTNQNLGGTPDPEPTNYPTLFAATPAVFSIILTWVDATGGQLPSAYLIKASDQDNIASPVDGVPVPDDPDLSDGTGAMNIVQGLQTYTFGDLESNKTYFFRIFPYTNSGININYKTDGTPPSANAITPNIVIINRENFNDSTLGSWTQHNIISAEQFWMIDNIHGISGSPCARMNGYDGAAIENEDWLISPAMNFDGYINEVFTFYTAMYFTGPELEVKISNEYDGTGDPNEFEWYDLTATLSPGGWAWTWSGEVDVSGISGTSVYAAFKYTSSDAEASTWEVDDILIYGEVQVGIYPQNDQGNSLSIYPVPAREKISVTFGNEQPKTVKIFTAGGSEICSMKTTGKTLEIDCSDFTPGIYLLEVTDESFTPQIKKLIVR